MFNVFEKIEILYKKKKKKKENDEKQGKFITIRKDSGKLVEIVHDKSRIRGRNRSDFEATWDLRDSYRIAFGFLESSFLYRIPSAIISRDVSFAIYNVSKITKRNVFFDKISSLK